MSHNVEQCLHLQRHEIAVLVPSDLYFEVIERLVCLEHLWLLRDPQTQDPRVADMLYEIRNQNPPIYHSHSLASAIHSFRTPSLPPLHLRLQLRQLLQHLNLQHLLPLPLPQHPLRQRMISLLPIL